jgi:hypothetical protein
MSKFGYVLYIQYVAVNPRAHGHVFMCMLRYIHVHMDSHVYIHMHMALCLRAEFCYAPWTTVQNFVM